MTILCQCKGLPKAAFEAAAMCKAQEIRDESSLKRAAAIVYRTTHPDKNGCSGCAGHIGTILVELGLRSADELPNASAAAPKDCGDCAACSRFDFL